MRKSVTFVDRLKNEKLFGDGSGHVLVRCVDLKKCTDELECLPWQRERGTYRGAAMNTPAVGQYMKTIHTPKSLMSAPFLQHPTLTAGQRHYLCSIANIYSTEHMRRQMKQHYVNVLHACLQSGRSDACRRKYGDHHHRESNTFGKPAEKDTTTRADRSRKQKKHSSRARSDITLPEIAHR